MGPRFPSTIQPELDKLRRLVALALGGGAAKAPASAFGQHSQSVATEAATILASATITPTLTGKLRVVVTGSVQPTGDSGLQAFTLSLSTGGSATPAIYTAPELYQLDNDINQFFATLALVVDLDLLGAPILFPVGTPVTLNAVLADVAASAFYNVQAQISVQEKAA